MSVHDPAAVPAPAAVIGAGLMGTQIAVVLAQQCPRVGLMSRRPESVAAARQRAAGYARALARHDLLPLDPERLLARLVPTTDFATAIDGAEFVVESIIENAAAKREVFARLDAALTPEVVLASNTSALPVAEFASGLRHPERVLISHFIQPAHIIPVLEVVPGPQTADWAVNRTVAFWHALGRRPLVMHRDVPGFLINRLQHALVREAVAILAAGLASAEEIDAAVQLGLAPRFTVLGPLRQRDINGLRMHINVAERLWPALDGSHVPALRYLRDLVGTGAAGLESGRGFYEWGDVDPAAERARLDDQLLRRVRQVLADVDTSSSSAHGGEGAGR